MDVALSDLLTCPRCGPTYGLIVLPGEVVDRRVRSGVLGCANCRERYGVEAGVADLRVGAGPEPAGAAVGEADRDAAVRLGALLDLTDGRGTVLLCGPAVSEAGLLAELTGVSVVAVAGAGAAAEADGVSVVRVTEALPLRSGSARGAGLTGGCADGLLEEGARVVGSGGRLVLDPAPSDAEARVEAAGLEVLLAERGVVVAGRGR